MMNEKFVLIDLKELNEMQIVDTEEDNILIFGCNYSDDERFFCEQELEQVVRLLNFQNKCIEKLEEKNEQLKQEINVYKKAFQEQVQRCTL